MARRGWKLVALGALTLSLAGCSWRSTPTADPTTAGTTSTGTTTDAQPASAAATTPGTASPTTTPSPTSAAGIVARMTVAQQAGSVIMTAATVPNFAALAATVRRYGLGGAMIRGRSAAGTTAVRGAVAPVRAAVSIPPLIATDEEGGEVQVLSGPGIGTIPSGVDQGKLSVSTLDTRARTWGRSLAAAGVDLDLAPVADVPCAADLHDNPPVADLDRQYGTDPDAVGGHVAAFVQGMGGAGVATTVKHFPGLGCVTANTDTTANVVDRTTTATSASLRSFAAGIRAGAAAVMVSSATYTRIDPDSPAVFSPKVVRTLLRGRMGFTGVVMTDDIGSAKAVHSVPVGDRATRFISAGGDLVLDVLPADVPALVKGLTAKAASDPVFAGRLRQAATIVMAERLALRH